MRAVGAGRSPLPVTKLTGGLTDRLADLVCNEEYRRCAVRTGGPIHAEDVVAQCVKVLEGIISA